jgi:peptidoglycan hydrolase CwlO-like protein
MAKQELSAAQRNAKREIGRLERRVKRTNKTQDARRAKIAQLRKKL